MRTIVDTSPMAYSNSNLTFEKMLLKFVTEEDPMLEMLKWLCDQLMEAEFSIKLGADKSDRSSERIGFVSRVGGIFPSMDSYIRLVTSYLIEYSEDWSSGRSYIDSKIIEAIHEGKLNAPYPSLYF